MDTVIREKTSARKAQIVETAQQLFREKGYSATSMRDLAKAVGIEPASLYNHISSKEAILQHICFHMAEEFFSAIEDIHLQPGGPQEKLRIAVHRHIGVIVNNLEASNVFFNEWRNLGEEDLQKFRSLRINYEYKFKEILQSGMETGAFKPVDVRIAIFTIFSAMNAIYDLEKPGVPIETDEVASIISTIILNGLNV